MNNYDKKNYYEILEIPTDASSEEVYQGYIKAKNTYSHDSIALYSLMTKEECDKILELVEEAHSILSDPDKRIKYNQARSIETTDKEFLSKEVEQPLPPMPEPQSMANRTTKGVMPRIVANKRFALDFIPNPEIEKKIEQTVEFTGEFLREIREYKNVDLRRMADMTKISKAYLKSIEEENWKNLPAIVYIRGFVYQYAKCLKLNPDLVATGYTTHLKKMIETQAS